jgi:hypothetical protein
MPVLTADLPQIIATPDCTQRFSEPLCLHRNQRGNRLMSANPNPDPAGETEPAPVSHLRLPRVEQHLSVLPEAAQSRPVEAEDTRNPMFGLLVQNESDVTGLLAYALYKQNKRDWLMAFQATHGRDPDTIQTEAFVLGERLPRRTATYRRLAGDLLRHDDTARSGLIKGLMQSPANDTAGMGAGLPGAGLSDPGLHGPGLSGPTLQQAAKSPATWRTIAVMLLMLVAMAVVFRLAGSWLFGTPGR